MTATATRNKPLKLAVVESGFGVVEIGQKMGHHFTWISKLIHGRVGISVGEKKKLARILDTRVKTIFPESAEEDNEI